LKKKWAMARQSSPKRPAHDQGEGVHTAVPKYADSIGYTSCATILEKTWTWHFSGRIAQKSVPRTPSDVWQQALVDKGLLEYGLKFGENCSPLTKTVSAVEKICFFNVFQPVRYFLKTFSSCF
jgi:hypothetical protein